MNIRNIIGILSLYMPIIIPAQVGAQPIHQAALKPANAPPMAMSSTVQSTTYASMGDIYAVHAMSNGAIIFFTNGIIVGTRPPCHSNNAPQRYAINASATTGQAMAATFLTAYSQKKRIHVQGAGVCDIWSDTETAIFIMLED